MGDAGHVLAGEQNSGSEHKLENLGIAPVVWQEAGDHLAQLRTVSVLRHQPASGGVVREERPDREGEARTSNGEVTLGVRILLDVLVVAAFGAGTAMLTAGADVLNTRVGKLPIVCLTEFSTACAEAAFGARHVHERGQVFDPRSVSFRLLKQRASGATSAEHGAARRIWFQEGIIRELQVIVEPIAVDDVEVGA
jgi:hypothetical protein